MPDPLVLSTDRLRLAPLTGTDVPELVAVLQTPEVARWWGPMTASDIDPDDPAVVQLAVRRVDDPRLLGLIQYSEESDPMYRSAGIDLALHPSAQGPGWASRPSARWPTT